MGREFIHSCNCSGHSLSEGRMVNYCITHISSLKTAYLFKVFCFDHKCYHRNVFDEHGFLVDRARVTNIKYNVKFND